MASSGNNETVHISLGTTANFLTSHFLNLQGLAATTSTGGARGVSDSNSGNDDADWEALCDPSVTHDVRPLDNDDGYSTHRASSSSSSSSSSRRYAYVPRTLIVDGRDSFGMPWGGGGGGGEAPSPPLSSSAPAIAWGGAVSTFDPKSVASSSFIGVGGIGEGARREEGGTKNDDDGSGSGSGSGRKRSGVTLLAEDPLARFQDAASALGLSPAHSRFRANPPHRATSSYNAGGGGGGGGGGRHVQWDNDDDHDEEGDADDDGDDDDCYRYGHSRDGEQKREEARRRKLEQMEHRANDARREWNRRMGDAWEEAFYPRGSSGGGGGGGGGDGNGGGDGDETDDIAKNDTMAGNAGSSDASMTTTTTTTKTDGCSRYAEREIRWHDYWMPPRPASGYRVPLPFDTSTSFDDPSDCQRQSWSTWSTSFDAGCRPGSGGVAAGSGLGGGGGGITNSWREHVLSESLRRVLEGCDVVKGFNVFVDGGGYCRGSASDAANANANVNAANANANTKGHGGGKGGNKHAERLSDIVAGGGFHAGLAASLMEELSEECRSAGRWAVMVDPPRGARTRADADVGGGPDPGDTEGERVHHFRRRLNAGLALHGLSTNADAFLPVSIDGAYRALRPDAAAAESGGGCAASPNRALFEGSAAVALALEASTLFYRLRRRAGTAGGCGGRSVGGAARRGRIGIQSGFYQGYSGNAGYEEFDNEPFATAPSMTYHEFLACARPSSDRRRSILELDALLRPISHPSAAATAAGRLSDVAISPWGNNGGALSSSVLASLQSSGLIGCSTNGTGELQKRMIRGTGIELMMMEQQRQQYRSSRARSSSRPREPGEWLDDISTKTCDGGGLLSSLSGNSIPFGMRADHHHFALSTALRPAESESRYFSSAAKSIPGGGNCATTAFLRPMMESMGVKYRPEVSLGVVVKDTVVDLTGVSAYWRGIFSDRSSTMSPASTHAKDGRGGSDKSQQLNPTMMSPNECASHTSILSVLGNSTRSYPRLNFISNGFVDTLSRRNMGYFSRDVMAGIVPERDDCEEALEYCRELVDVYEPPMGGGLVSGEDENDNLDAYFDEKE